ncbi:MAG TPA: hypothetical protein VGF30_12750 [Bacteroidia bacterium]
MTKTESEISPGAGFKLLFILLIFSFYKTSAQDTLIFNGKTYNQVIYYDDTAAVKIAGNYMPGTKIKNGEWLCFYKNGQVSARMYFKKDLARGEWTWYDQNGEVARKEVMKEKNPDRFRIFESIDQREAWFDILELILCIASKGRC